MHLLFYLVVQLIVVFGMILGKNAWQSLFVLDLEVWEKPFNRFQIFFELWKQIHSWFKNKDECRLDSDGEFDDRFVDDDIAFQKPVSV